MIKVIVERCPQNHRCPLIKKCSKQAIIQEGFRAPNVDQEKCIECLVCVKNCPNEAFAEADEQPGTGERVARQ